MSFFRLTSLFGKMVGRHDHMPPWIENMVPIKKWRNQTLKPRKFMHFFYRKRRVVVNPPYCIMEFTVKVFAKRQQPVPHNKKQR